MISAWLLERLACPVCLEPEGCPACSRGSGGHETCVAEYGERARCACGGPDKVRLRASEKSLDCPCCGASYACDAETGHADLVPREERADITQYADHEFHERLGVKDGPPVLSARVKADMMRRMLEPSAGEDVLDLGCGAGKLALFAQRSGARVAGVDVAPFFLPRAVASLDLVLGDLRRLPFRKGSFSRAYTLDVLEHLEEDGVASVLLEARRTIGAQGRLFVYTHAMESSRLARFQRWVNALARRLGRWGLIDHEREAMRKSDHRNAIRSHEHFDSLCERAGLVVSQRRYYNVVAKAVIEDLGLRLVEQLRRRRQEAKPVAHEAHGEVESHAAPVPIGRGALALATLLTWLMKLDVVLFGGIRTGPFFGLLEPRR